MRKLISPLVLATIALLSLLALACGPAASPTATTGAAPTATTGASVATATVASAGQPTTADATKIRPVPVVAAPAPNPRAQKGGVYRSLAGSDPPHFGIWDSAVSTTLQTAIPVYDTLLDTNEYEPDKLQQILPSMSYDWWTNQAGDEWTFKLRDGIKFTDNVVLTCADVKFSLESIRDARDSKGSQLISSPRGAYIRRIKDITCPDASTVVIKTDAPLPSLVRTLALVTFSILPRHVYEGHLDLESKQIGPGQGGFMFDSYKPTESLVLKRNPNHWNQPYPYLDQIQILNLGSATSVMAAIQVGRGEESASAGISLPKPTRDKLEQEGKIYVIQKEASDGFNAVHTNWQKAPYNDKRFALALRCAIDSRKAIDTVSNGEGYEGPIFPLADTPGGSEWSLTKQDWKALGPCHGPTTETNMEQRRQMARDLLAQMGFTADKPAKPDVQWWSIGNMPQVWESLDGDLRAVGIQPNMTLNETNAYYAKAGSGEFDLTPGSFATSRRDPDHWLYEHFYSTSARNYGKYVNAETDVLIDKQSKTLDPTERKKVIDQISKALLTNNAKIVIYHTYSGRAFSAWVKDMYWGKPSNNQSTGAKYTRVWLDQAKMKQVLGQ